MYRSVRFLLPLMAMQWPVFLHALEPSALPRVALADLDSSDTAVVVGDGVENYKFPESFANSMTPDIAEVLLADPSMQIVDKTIYCGLASAVTPGTVTPEKLSGIAEVTGAGYYVCGDVEMIELDRRSQNFPGYTQTKLVGRVVVNLRIVDLKSSRLIYSRKINNVISSVLNRYSNVTVDSFVEELRRDTVARIASGIADGVSPIQICAIEDGKVYLRRGHREFRGGEVLDIIIPEVAPYSGQDDIFEDQAGKVRVESIGPDMAVARIIENEKPMEVGYFARRLE